MKPHDQMGKIHTMAKTIKVVLSIIKNLIELLK